MNTAAYRQISAELFKLADQLNKLAIVERTVTITFDDCTKTYDNKEILDMFMVDTLTIACYAAEFYNDCDGFISSKKAVISTCILDECLTNFGIRSLLKASAEYIKKNAPKELIDFLNKKTVTIPSKEHIDYLQSITLNNITDEHYQLFEQFRSYKNDAIYGPAIRDMLFHNLIDINSACIIESC